MYRYAVLGSGQGAATAYDLAKFGEAEVVFLFDVDQKKAQDVADHLNALLRKHLVCPRRIDATDEELTWGALRTSHVNTIVGAISYKLNESLSRIAIDVRANYIDMGGNTEVVRQQHKLHKKARRAGVSVIPDCGMGPGFNLSLAHAVARRLLSPKTITVYCGGLPQRPEGPLNYALFFSMDGLVNEYCGNADILRGGKWRKQPTTEVISPICLGTEGSRLFESSHTSGGLSTAPWTFRKLFPTLRNLEYQTLRYPGHFEQIRAWKKEGVLRERLVERLGTSLSRVEDIGIIHVEGQEADQNGMIVATVEDQYDPMTGFSAMQRLTGFHASVMAILATRKFTEPGVIPVESVDGETVIREMEKRGIHTAWNTLGTQKFA